MNLTCEICFRHYYISIFVYKHAHTTAYKNILIINTITLLSGEFIILFVDTFHSLRMKTDLDSLPEVTTQRGSTRVRVEIHENDWSFPDIYFCIINLVTTLSSMSRLFPKNNHASVTKNIKIFIRYLCSIYRFYGSFIR